MKKLHRIIKFKQQSWLESYIDMNSDLKKAKTNFKKGFYKLMDVAVFGKTMENMSKHRYIKLVITERKRNILVSEPNYHTTSFFTENLLAKIYSNIHE